jgi:hypothetical protein
METEEKVYDIYFNAVENYVVMQWNGYATSNQFREGTELMLNTLIQHKSTKVLADIRSMKIIGMEDQQWLEKDFIPRAVKFGFEALAIIQPTAYFNKVAVETVSYKVDKEKLSISFFDNMASAKEWLKNIKQT